MDPDRWDFTEESPRSLDELILVPVGTRVTLMLILAVPLTLANVPRRSEVIELYVDVEVTSRSSLHTLIHMRIHTEKTPRKNECGDRSCQELPYPPRWNNTL